jgi:cytidyltransferase-like protein
MIGRKNILSLETIYKIAYDLKARGKKICLTHGAFDLFHNSHLDLLKKSSQICDYLIVGVDSDQSLVDYKSYKRPIVDEDSRLAIISELDCVDAVFIKNIPLTSDSRINLYRNFLTDFVSIGLNYAIEEEIRYDSAQAGTRLIKFHTEQNYTTSSLIQKIIDKYVAKTEITST